MKTPIAALAVLWLAACTPATPDPAASTPEATPAGSVADAVPAAPASVAEVVDDPRSTRPSTRCSATMSVTRP